MLDEARLNKLRYWMCIQDLNSPTEIYMQHACDDYTHVRESAETVQNKIILPGRVFILDRLEQTMEIFDCLRDPETDNYPKPCLIALSTEEIRDLERNTVEYTKQQVLDQEEE